MPIFDQGYQHWKGPLAGHAWRWLAIARQGVRVQVRGWIVRILLILAWLPAVALVIAVVLWGLVEQKSQRVLGFVAAILPADVLLDPRAYRGSMWTLAYSLFFQVEMFFIMLLLVAAGPGLISRDLRFNALPLYFSRPLTRLDYFLGKLGVIAVLVAAVAVVPALVAYVVGAIFSLDLSVVKDTYPVLLGSVAYGLVITLSAGTLMLALSSLSRRSLYVGIAWFGLWWISGAVGSILTEIHNHSARQEVREPALAAWVQEHPPPPGVQMNGLHPVLQLDEKRRKMKLAGVQPGHEGEAEEWYAAWSRAFEEASQKAEDAQGELAHRDWRPMCAYVTNLERIADALLDTDAAWVQVGGAVERAQQMAAPVMFGGPAPAPVNERRLADQYVLQYPWWWSAGALAGLMGVSVWVLTRRVKSLDRLR